jgi:predicted Zn-dependent protease with MMP-like domain
MAGARSGSCRAVPSVRTLSVVQRENRLGGLGGSARRRTRQRDRRGRGLRTPLAPREVPIARSRAARFDDLVLDAIEDLERHLADEMQAVEFAIEDVPPGDSTEFDPDTVSDRGVALGRLYRSGLGSIDKPVVVVYRRPLEARAVDPIDRGDLVFTVVTELVAELLGKDIDEIDPP